eukprot:m51a1_g4855 hypothetical protein (123) ;mRNA; r:305079-305500
MEVLWVLYPQGADAVAVRGAQVGWSGAQLKMHIKEARKVPYEEADVFLGLPDGLPDAVYMAYAVDSAVRPRILDSTQNLGDDFFVALKTLKKPFRPVIEILIREGATLGSFPTNTTKSNSKK